MMTADTRSLVSEIPPMDTFSFGPLNEALDELNTLNTNVIVPSKNDTGVNGQRVIDMRATFSESTLRRWRNTSHHPIRFNIGVLTKENMDVVGSEIANHCSFDYLSESHCAKVVHARTHRNSRTNPYHRKPLYSLWGRSRSLHDGDSLTNRLSGCHFSNGDYHLRSLRSVNSLPRLYEVERQGRIPMETINFQPSSLLFEDIGLKRKTEDYCSYSIPAPVLTRSKSLEDLRESIKPKLKSLSTDMSSSSGSTYDASLSPRRTIPSRNVGNRNPSTFPLYPRRILENCTSHTPDVKSTSSDVDSMSVLIGKLNVS